MPKYGEPPVVVGKVSVTITEFMHYQYLPIKMPHTIVRLPCNLEGIKHAVYEAVEDAEYVGRYTAGDYIYVTVKRRFATSDSPLNRPGWHSDGFGTDDLNFIWYDRYPTRFAVQDFTGIDPNHHKSMAQFETQVSKDKIVMCEAGQLLRLNPYVVHTTPEILDGGSMRTFLKVSFSKHKYNLIDNSHNHLFAYSWKLFPRSTVRNHPTQSEADFVEES